MSAHPLCFRYYSVLLWQYLQQPFTGQVPLLDAVISRSTKEDIAVHGQSFHAVLMRRIERVAGADAALSAFSHFIHLKKSKHTGPRLWTVHTAGKCGHSHFHARRERTIHSNLTLGLKYVILRNHTRLFVHDSCPQICIRSYARLINETHDLFIQKGHSQFILLLSVWAIQRK